MIIFNLPKFIKHEKGLVYFKSKSIDWGRFCDFSPSENLVEIEHLSSERNWYDISVFFYDYNIKIDSYIGIATGSLARFYKVIGVEERSSRGKSALYALLEFTPCERALDSEKDCPLNRDSHEMPSLPKGLTDNEMEKASSLLDSIGRLIKRGSTIENRISRNKVIIKKLKKKVKTDLDKLNEINNDHYDLISQLRELENDSTCWGCCAKCDIPHETFSPRCNRYDDLPF